MVQKVSLRLGSYVEFILRPWEGSPKWLYILRRILRREGGEESEEITLYSSTSEVP